MSSSFMKLSFRLTLSILFLSGCATSQNFAYDSNTSKAMLVHKFDGYEPFISLVDLEKKSASGNNIRLGNGTTIYSKSLKNGFGQKMIEPGNYALTQRFSPVSGGYYTSYCFEDNAVVFHVKSGVLNVIEDFDTFIKRAEQTLNLPNAELPNASVQVLNTAKESVAYYPNISAKVELVEIKEIINFAKSDSWGIMKGKCGTSKSLE